MTLEAKLNAREVNSCGFGDENIPGRRNSTFKGPELGGLLRFWKDSREGNMYYE